MATDKTVHVATWVYIVIGVALIGCRSRDCSICWPWELVTDERVLVLAMLGVLVMLFFVHQKSRKIETEKRSQYWREQVRGAITPFLSEFLSLMPAFGRL